MIELTRHLHNHAAAAYSLQQHIDVFQKKVSDESVQGALKERSAEAGKQDYGRFFQNLRTYLQHYASGPEGNHGDARAACAFGYGGRPTTS